MSVNYKTQSMGFQLFNIRNNSTCNVKCILNGHIQAKKFIQTWCQFLTYTEGEKSGVEGHIHLTN